MKIDELNIYICCGYLDKIELVDFETMFRHINKSYMYRVREYRGDILVILSDVDGFDIGTHFKIIVKNCSFDTADEVINYMKVYNRNSKIDALLDIDIDI